MRIGRVIVACALGLGVAVGVISTAALAEAPLDRPAVDTLMLDLIATHNVPGAALALIKRGEVVLEKSYGFRHLATRAPVTAQTLFNIGSISKSFTALGIAQLVDHHKLDLDAPVIGYAPDLRLSDPQVTRKVTLRQLLSHTSGLPADEQWPSQVAASRLGIIRELQRCRSRPNRGHGFSTVGGASYSRRTSSSASAARPGKHTLRRRSLRRSG